MTITGELIIGRRAIRGSGSQLNAQTPNGNHIIEPIFSSATDSLVDEACNLAAEAFDVFKTMPLEKRADFLDKIATCIENIGDILIVRAHSETGLTVARLKGERTRTVKQLRSFAAVVRSGHWLAAAIDNAQSNAGSASRPDLRTFKVPLGPVVVFGASNFPLAFSVAGGDTASALAAGCPVIVKAHSAHLGTSELVARAVQEASIESDMPDGVFSLVAGPGNEIGTQLVAHPAIKAVGFTGSRKGGLALLDVSSRRKEPIPVYAEMSSINPFFVLPGALAKRSKYIAAGLADSIALGAGQFCTNPGLIVIIDSELARDFINELGLALGAKSGQTMLTPGIAKAYNNALEHRLEDVKVHKILSPTFESSLECDAKPALFSINAKDFMANSLYQEEIFGPASLIVMCQNSTELQNLSNFLEGQLTSTLHFEEDDITEIKKLLPILEKKVGRIIANGYPTGVEVSYAMVHGGPFPSSSDSRTTSVGASAIDRFLRPVCYQDFSAEFLPPAVQDDNPFSLWRLRDGKMQNK